MTTKLRTLLIASVIAFTSFSSLAVAQGQASNPGQAPDFSQMFNPYAFMGQQGTMPQGGPPNPFITMLAPNNWVNPNAYMAFMNPQSWGTMMNPMSYMGFMNPAAYSQMMNPAAYMNFMNPATYSQAMDPNSYMAGMMQMFQLIQNEEAIPTDFWGFLKKQEPATAESAEPKE